MASLVSRWSVSRHPALPAPQRHARRGRAVTCCAQRPIELPGGAFWWLGLAPDWDVVYGPQWVIQRPKRGGEGLVLRPPVPKPQRCPAPGAAPTASGRELVAVKRADAASCQVGFIAGSGLAASYSVVIDTDFELVEDIPPPSDAGCVGIVHVGSAGDEPCSAASRSRHPRRTHKVRRTAQRPPLRVAPRERRCWRCPVCHACMLSPTRLSIPLPRRLHPLLFSCTPPGPFLVQPLRLRQLQGCEPSRLARRLCVCSLRRLHGRAQAAGQPAGAPHPATPAWRDNLRCWPASVHGGGRLRGRPPSPGARQQPSVSGAER